MAESRPVGINRRVAGSSPASGANTSLCTGFTFSKTPAAGFTSARPMICNASVSHNRTDKVGGKFTRKNGPWELFWSEEHATRASAMARERQIKSMKSARWIRETLLDGRVPTGRD